MSWADCELGDVVTLKRGHDLPNGKRKEGDIPVVSSSGITGWHNEAKAEAPGVVTGRYGTIGEVFFLDRPYWPLNTALYAIDFHENDPRFIAYFLRSHLKNYKSEKAAVPGVDRNVLHKLKVRCPDLPAQESIAAVLSAYDDLIENNRRRIALLEQAARLLYREWFVHFRFPGYETAKFVDGLPEGWERTAFSEAAFINQTTNWDKSKNRDIRMVPMGALSESGMICDASQFERREKPTGVKFMKGDTLFARITPCLENGKTAYVDFLDEGEVACGSTEFIVFRERKLSRYMIYLLAREDGFRQNAVTSMVGSSGRQRVQNSCFDKFMVSVPPDEIVVEFDQKAEPLFRQIASLVASNHKLAKARDILLPRLMDGRLSNPA
ncbi:putative nucleotidyltransferases [Jannaschia seosinensis]|uniref:Putative nucleotidyltransferases n=1 Tax=Jannaschia seosinensis TaxID=313367 RepID=A0A0M7BAN3_9RHOB|nr:restriction endonuclease subunit S [Jannaschia seosinensis]CUH39451.1 putative nucleotidyltransferases [Jannaschia seosinensis]